MYLSAIVVGDDHDRVDPKVYAGGTLSNEVDSPSSHALLHAAIWRHVGELIQRRVARSLKIINNPALMSARY